jgi:beta-glucosidase
LSFTNFAYSGLQVHLIHDSDQQTLLAEITVRNSGQREGKEVVELHVSQHSASITPPRKRLKRFVKIILAPGEIRHITFELTAEDLSFIGAENKLVFEPGLFDLTIGGLSQTIDWK